MLQVSLVVKYTLNQILMDLAQWIYEKKIFFDFPCVRPLKSHDILAIIIILFMRQTRHFRQGEGDWVQLSMNFQLLIRIKTLKLKTFPGSNFQI